MNAWGSTPPAAWPALDDIMAMTWGPSENWEAIAIPVINLDTPQAEPQDTHWLDLAAGGGLSRSDLIRLAGAAEEYAGNVRVATARHEHGTILVTCHRLRSRDRLGDWPADYRAYFISGNALIPCCEPDGDDRQELCGNPPEPWSRHCSAHQDADDARRRLAVWQQDRFRVRDERDPAVRAAHAAGVTKHAIYVQSGIARTTIDEILGATVERPSITVEQIVALRDEAGQAGDLAQVEVCTRALDGDGDAWAECERVIADAAAQ